MTAAIDQEADSIGESSPNPSPPVQLNANAQPFRPSPTMPPPMIIAAPTQFPPPLLAMPMPPPHPVQKVGFMGGIHYHGVHKHEGIKMEELATLLQQVAKNAKAEALQEFQHQKHY